MQALVLCFVSILETHRTAKQIRLARRDLSKKTPSYNVQQKQYAESQGKFKNDTEGRDKQYELDIEYIQSIPTSDVPKEWMGKMEEIIEQHVSDTKNTTRFKSKVIKTVFDFRKQQVNRDTALEKMLNVLQEDK